MSFLISLSKIFTFDLGIIFFEGSRLIEYFKTIILISQEKFPVFIHNNKKNYFLILWVFLIPLIPTIIPVLPLDSQSFN